MNFNVGLPASVINQILVCLKSIGNFSFYTLIINIFLGFVIGSLINYFSDVLPATRRFSQPVCPECSHPYPIKDYLLTLPCPHCGHKQPKRHLIVLITSVILCVLLQFFPFHGLSFWATIPLLIYLGVIVVIDLEHRLVLVETSLFGLILMLAYGFTFHGF